MTLITFQKNNTSITRDCFPSLVSEKLVYKDGSLKSVAEIIFFEWTDIDGSRREASFSGIESYFLQFTIENLRSLAGVFH